MMKILILISRIITGIVFTFSGFVKAVDPVGTQIKFGDYFDAMGLEGLMPYALIFSFLLNAAELVIGLMLIFNIFPRLAIWSAFGFLIIFTPLTLWLAVANPVSDCGCFGDAITLTNWQTFWKNVIFLVFVLAIILWGRQFKSGLSFKKSIIGFSVFVFIALGFEFYNYLNLPLLDFRPFKEGVNIDEASSIPEGAEQDVYETVLYYKNLKTGESQAFAIEEIPYEDTLNWAYDTTITELISKGYEPPIHDFFLTNLNGEEITEKILNDEKLSLIYIMHEIEIAFKRVKEELNKTAEFADKNGLNIYVFTSSESSEIRAVSDQLPENVIICTGDDTMLKTVVRSNPGFVLLKNAVLLKKYHYRNIPDIENIKKYK